MIFTPGRFDLNDIPPAQALYSLGFVLVLLRLSPRLDWRPLDRVVSALNRRAVTIYLWHNPAIAACFVVGDAVGAWRLGQAGYLAVALVLLLGPVMLLGWIEDVSRLGSRYGRGSAAARDLHGIPRGDRAA